MGNKQIDKKSKDKQKYFTVMETLWKIGAPFIVAVAKTVIENKAIPFIK